VPNSDQTVLEWWRGHKSDFSLVSKFARIVLVVSASQIECLSDLAEARLRLKELEVAPSHFSNQQEVEYELELGVATENILLDNDADLA